LYIQFQYNPNIASENIFINLIVNELKKK
jgi:hypothetical protein